MPLKVRELNGPARPSTPAPQGASHPHRSTSAPRRLCPSFRSQRTPARRLLTTSHVGYGDVPLNPFLRSGWHRFQLGLVFWRGMLGYGKGKDCRLTKIPALRFSDRGARACLAIGFRRLIPFLILRSLSLSAPMPLTVTERPVFALRTTVVVTGEALSTCFPDDALRVFAMTFKP